MLNQRKQLFYQQQIIKFEQFQQFAVNLEQLGDSINQQAIEQNEKIYMGIFKNLQKQLLRTELKID
ncbi:unnamed protein product [Paramecium sonneborni]|uniref:Uncharacterized protein n=1 Tax=Paramecium sonneborni TaxID=65129 RepID=A0A8S1RR55_9CILI|nr:unnamed protein product [Paramecium sonneborni]